MIDRRQISRNSIFAKSPGHSSGNWYGRQTGKHTLSPSPNITIPVPYHHSMLCSQYIDISCPATGPLAALRPKFKFDKVLGRALGIEYGGKTRNIHIPRGQLATSDPQTRCDVLCDGVGGHFGAQSVSSRRPPVIKRQPLYQQIYFSRNPTTSRWERVPVVRLRKSCWRVSECRRATDGITIGVDRHDFRIPH